TDPRVKLIWCETRQGPAIARNMGLRKAQGELIAFNDDDDFWQKDKLKIQVNALMKAERKVGVVYVRIKRKRKDHEEYIPDRKKRKKEGRITKALLKENFIGLPAVMVKREFIKKAGFFDEKMSRNEDWEWFVRLSQACRFLYLPQVLVESLLLPSGITKNQSLLLQANKRFYQKHQEKIEKNKKIAALWQFRLGDAYYHLNKMMPARKYFFQAFKKRPTFKYFRAICKTLLGKQVSEGLISVKIKFKENLGGRKN
ncbi:MAG: glycosyltransferase family 2 protein, partial [Candidatus Marinimicrobia bacterium]|nr:glycosyltransferase family 2 protein [Candidatus Neomarinimicrobiota bacterium]